VRWNRRRSPAARSRLAVVLTVVLGAVTPTLWLVRATDASLTGVTTTQTQWSTGSVVLTDDDSDQALFSVSGLIPGQSRSRCLTVGYTGSFPAQVRLYGSPGGTGLADHLDLQITRGSFAGSGDAGCTGFTADGTAYLGTGHDPGVVYDSTLAAFPTSWNAATEEPDGTDTGHWLPGDTHAYRFTLTLRGDDAAAGLTAAPTFVVAARNDTQPELRAGQTLHNGVILRNSTHGNILAMQGDGNLVVYDSQMTALWHTNSWMYGSTVELRLQPDGNLVLAAPGVGTLWQSGTAGSGATKLVLRADGHLELQAADGTSVWAN
jgi:hypothetical protein